MRIVRNSLKLRLILDFKHITLSLFILAQSATSTFGHFEYVRQVTREIPPPAVTNEDAVRLAEEAFRDYPVLLAIARCESGMRQFDASGKVLQGVKVSTDRGFMQINEHYHKEDALALGFDIEKPEGNIGYALWLYKKNGTKDWLASKSCWSKATDKT